jgi:hypothetical protein
MAVLIYILIDSAVIPWSPHSHQHLLALAFLVIAILSEVRWSIVD